MACLTTPLINAIYYFATPLLLLLLLLPPLSLSFTDTQSTTRTKTKSAVLLGLGFFCFCFCVCVCVPLSTLLVRISSTSKSSEPLLLYINTHISCCRFQLFQLCRFVFFVFTRLFYCIEFEILDSLPLSRRNGSEVGIV